MTPWTVARQASLSMGFSRQEYWSELPFPSPGDLPNPGIEPWSPASQAGSLPFEPPGNPGWKILVNHIFFIPWHLIYTAHAIGFFFPSFLILKIVLLYPLLFLFSCTFMKCLYFTPFYFPFLCQISIFPICILA